MDSIIIGGGEDPLNVTIPYDEEPNVNISDGENSQVLPSSDTVQPIATGTVQATGTSCDPVNEQSFNDAVQEYSCSMLWRGLLHMVQTDAERHNNGEFLISDWRLDMVEFWNLNHFKYLMLGHRLLAGINGWLPPPIQQEIIWNSTGNIHGGAGHNVALDLVNEFLNNEFKTNLKNSHGQYTDDHVARCSKIVGGIGKAVENVFQTDFVCDSLHRSASKKPDNMKSLKKFVEIYKPYQLFDKVDNSRHHTGMESFKHVIRLNHPDKLCKRLQKYTKKLQNEEYLLQN